MQELEKFAEAVARIAQQPKMTEHKATVTSVDSSSVTVQIDGSTTTTTCTTWLATCHVGDRVVVTIDPKKRSATVKGNLTNVPTDDTTALEAIDRADVATAAANDALTAAENAETAAGNAQTAAGNAVTAAGNAATAAANAKTAADAAQADATQALADAATAAGAASSATTAAQAAQGSATAAGEAAARAQAAADAAQGDIDDMQEYFWHDALGAHVLSDLEYEAVTPAGTENPSSEGWYELDAATGTYSLTTDISVDSSKTYYKATSIRYRQDMKGAGTEFFELDESAGTQTSVAAFGGSGATIGKSNSTRFAITSNRLVGINSDSVPLFDVDYSGTASRTFKAQGDTTAYPFKATGLYRFSYTQTVDVSSADIGETISIDTLSSYGAYMRLRAPTTGERIEFGINSVSKYACDVTVTHASDYNELRMLATATRTFTAGTSAQTTIAANNIYCYMYAADGTSIGSETMSLRCTITYDADAGTVTFHWGVIISHYFLHCLLAIPQHRVTWQTTTIAPAYTLGTRSGTSGGFSVAAGLGIIASTDYQTAIGTYNEEDANGDYLLIVGNGSSETSRANAFTVDTSGNIKCGTVNSLDVGAIADYVVDQGTSGIWTYRKWNSGLAECWGTYSASIAVNTTSPAYGGYRSAQQNVTMPSGLFNAQPHVTGTFATSQGVWLTAMWTTSRTNIAFFLSCGASMSAASRPVNITVHGRWK